MRDFDAPNPVVHDGEGGGLGVTVGQRDGFTPSSESIHMGKEETVGKGDQPGLCGCGGNVHRCQ